MLLCILFGSGHILYNLSPPFLAACWLHRLAFWKLAAPNFWPAMATEKAILEDVLHFNSLAANQKASGLSALPWWRLIVTGSNAWPGYVNGRCSSVASFEGKDKFYAVAKEEIGHCRVKQEFRKHPWIKVCGSISGHRWRKICIIGFRSGVHDVLFEKNQRTKSITHT